jgi:hypothetical protein
MPQIKVESVLITGFVLDYSSIDIWVVVSIAEINKGSRGKWIKVKKSQMLIQPDPY